MHGNGAHRDLPAGWGSPSRPRGQNEWACPCLLYTSDTTFANKGIGVRSICKTLDIYLADVMAFGDNYNDVSMLDIVGVPYIMDGAAAPLREKYPNHTPCPEDVLREFLKQN